MVHTYASKTKHGKGRQRHLWPPFLLRFYFNGWPVPLLPFVFAATESRSGSCWMAVFPCNCKGSTPKWWHTVGVSVLPEKLSLESKINVTDAACVALLLVTGQDFVSFRCSWRWKGATGGQARFLVYSGLALHCKVRYTVATTVLLSFFLPAAINNLGQKAWLRLS